MRRPRIGVSGPRSGGEAAWQFTRLALLRAGAAAVRLTAPGDRWPAGLDGLVLGGGPDITVQGPLEPPGASPALPASILRIWRGRARRLASLLAAPLVLASRRLLAVPGGARTDPARDIFERRLLLEAWARGLPVLGICRGAQMMSLAAGGALHPEVADLYGEVPHPHTVLPQKRVQLRAGSRLARILGATGCRVNALHHQAIREPGAGFSVAAKDEAGVIQAIEHDRLPFCIGVQWHPEYMPLHEQQQALFKALAGAARAGPTG